MYKVNYEVNELNQKIGIKVPNWEPVKYPEQKKMNGNYCRLEPLNIDAHAKDLFEAYCLDKKRVLWTYLPYGPFENLGGYRQWLEKNCLSSNPLFFSIIDEATQKAAGVAAYMRIDPDNGSVEVGHLCYSPLLSRTRAATEAMYLMMKHAFELGYRRYEWKCNALNMPSRMAAQRLGFSYEGIFRQSVVTKGRNRDTAWFAAIDSEWGALKEAFEIWLSEDNFDKDGVQKKRLSDLTDHILVSKG